VSGPNVIADRFVIHAEIAAGGMGRVYRAHDRALGRLVAVKVLQSDGDLDAARFEREAAVLAGFRHDHIVSYIAHGVSAGERWLAMDWVDGKTLAHRFEASGLSVAETVVLGRHVARALAEAHAHGVLHRDLKPTNLVLEGDDVERVKLIDFGVARRIADPRILTRTGLAMGTPGYMAPEQARGLRALDGRADLFALGAILYEGLTGLPAFAGHNVTAVMCKIVLLDPPPLGLSCPEAPPALAGLVRALLDKVPDRRPANGHVVADELERLGPLAAGPRRRRGLSAAQVTASTPDLADPSSGGFTQLTVLAAGSADRRGVRASWDEGECARIGALLESFGAGVETLQGGTVVGIVASTDPTEAIERALLAGVAVRGQVAGGDVVVALGDGSQVEPLVSAVERGAEVLTAAGVAVLRGDDDTVAGGVRIDAGLVPWVPAAFEVVRLGRSVWARARARH
jgi:predicted Ser/Thr protein kinase